MITKEELAQRIEDVRKSCLTFSHSSIFRDKALDKIYKIIRHATRTQLQAHDPNAILVCTVKLLFYYYEESLLANENVCEWKRRRKVRMARDCYYDLLRIYIPEKSQEVVETIINIIYQDKLWRSETLCFDIVHGLLDCGASGATMTQVMWNKVESPSINLEDTREIVKILYEVLDVYSWPETQDTVAIIERILSLYRMSISDKRTSASSYGILRKGLEVCVRNTVKNLSNDYLLIVVQRMCSWAVECETSDKIVLDFGSTLEYTAYLHRSTLFEKTLTPTLFPLLMQMIASRSKIVNLLGNRVAQYLIDRGENRMVFDTPKIFFENAQFDLKFGECRKEDKLFLKVHREIVHDSLLKSLLSHSESRMNLETTYCTICLFALEVPCGFTAAAIVCLAMNLQEITLKQKRNDREVVYHIHATIIAIMSLLCWIHKAKAFYNYVNKIMMERAQWAPHLNPPIRSQYHYAIHHILWDKPELFFVDWEARYGLWKCFRLLDNRNSIQSN